MSVAFYFDVHVDGPICKELRRRGVEVLTAQEDHADTHANAALLERATELGRVLVTYDNRFRALAEDWQRQQHPFARLLFGLKQSGGIGDFVRDLELVAKASDPSDWVDRIEFIPFKTTAKK
jgi:hypothetical protein